MYQPCNSVCTATIKGQVMSYQYTPDMDVTQWLSDMQRLFNSLCALDTLRITDSEFALAILDLMPQDDTWRNFTSNLRNKIMVYDEQQQPIHSAAVVTAIREEY